MSVTDLPTLNAGLNAAATVMLLAGYLFIRNGNQKAHKRAMLSAFLASAAFLISYLIYHYNVGSVKYQGPYRTFYLGILVTHVILAATIPVLASITLYRAWKGNFTRHKSIARVTLPIWLYVGVTGVVVYLMLYRM